MKNIFVIILFGIQFLNSQHNNINQYAVNGVIWDIITDGDIVYSFGSFDRVGYKSGKAVSVDMISGIENNQFPYFNGIVRAMISDGEDGFFVGGDFTQVGQFKRNHIVHILADGSVDPMWDVKIDGTIFSLVATESILYISEVIGYSQSSYGTGRIRAVSMKNGAPSTLLLNVDGPVHTMIVHNNILYLGGNYSRINGIVRNRLGAYDLNEYALTPWNPSPSGTVTSMNISNEIVYLIGDFTLLKNENYMRYGIAAVPVGSDTPLSWHPTFIRGMKTALAIYDSVVFIAAQGYGIATVHATSGDSMDMFLQCEGLVSDMKIIGNKIYVAGRFNKIGGVSRKEIARIDLDNKTVDEWTTSISGLILVCAFSGQSLAFGGDLMTKSSRERTGVFGYDVQKDTIIDFQVTLSRGERFGSIIKAFLDDSVLYFFGYFDKVNGRNLHKFGAVNIYSGEIFDLQLDSSVWFVRDIVIKDSLLYIAGEFIENNTWENEVRIYHKKTGKRKDVPISLPGTTRISYHDGYFYLANVAFDTLRQSMFVGSLVKVSNVFDSVLWATDVGRVINMKFSNDRIYLTGVLHLQDTIQSIFSVGCVNYQGVILPPRVEGYSYVSTMEIVKSAILIGGYLLQIGVDNYANMVAYEKTDLSMIKYWKLPDPYEQIFIIKYSNDQLYLGGDISQFGDDLVGGILLLNDNMLSVRPIGPKTSPVRSANLFNNYPNPFNSQTTIVFDVQFTSNIRLSVYDLLGKHLSTIVDENYEPGKYKVNFDASNFSSGVYYYVLTEYNRRIAKKMLLIK
jgi:hypothetical protein